MAVWTIARLTLQEAVRRRTFVGALLIGLLIVALSLTLAVIRGQMEHLVATGARDRVWLFINYPVVRSHITTLCLFAIRVLGSIFAILLAGGSISAEIERGLLSVILARPITRLQLLLGKWLGLNLVLAVSVFGWTAMVWYSLVRQTGAELTPILQAGVYLTLFPILICTLTLTLATVAQRLVGTSVALAISAFSWFDGILNALGNYYDADPLRRIANLASVVMPQGSVAWWIRGAMDRITFPDPRVPEFGVSPEVARNWGAAHLHYAHFDAVYLAVYLVSVFLLGARIFERRDV